MKTNKLTFHEVSRKHNSILQDFGTKLVSREIYHRANNMMSSLPFEVVEQHDATNLVYAVQETTNFRCDCECGVGISGNIDDELDTREVIEHLTNDLQLECESCKERLDFDHLEVEAGDPIDIEIFEHWIISDWLASKFKEHDQIVGEIFDFTIWGRQCTGQAICLDYVIQKIAWELWESEILQAVESKSIITEGEPQFLQTR